MATKKTKQNNVRKLQRQNNGSTTIALPPTLLREFKWRDKQKVVVKKRGQGILIEDWVPPKKKSAPKKKATASKKKATPKRKVAPKKTTTKKTTKKTNKKKK